MVLHNSLEAYVRDSLVPQYELSKKNKTRLRSYETEIPNKILSSWSTCH